MAQIDKLAEDVEGFINEYEFGIIRTKEKLVQVLCFYIGERVKMAVESREHEIAKELEVVKSEMLKGFKE